MRVGLFSNAYRPVVSGVVNSLDEIRKGLLQRGHTPFLFAPEAKGFREQHAGVFRFPSVELDRSVEFPVPIPFSARLSRLIPRMNLSLIHSHHPILIGATAANFAKRLQCPLVYTFHTQIEEYSHYVPFFNQQVVKARARAKVSTYLAKSDLVICPSPNIRKLIESYGGVHSRIETVPNAIDVRKFLIQESAKNSLRKRLGIPDDCFLSLSVGRLAPEKGLPFLLRAFSAMTTPSHHLVCVGSGPQLYELQELCLQLRIESRVHFLGSVCYAQMPKLYADSDLFVICSTTEVKPLVVLEALASGKPVLAVSACGTSDTLRHGHDGWLCELDEVEYAAAWSRFVLDSDFRLQLGKNARKTAQGYSIEGYLDRLCQLYRETIDLYRDKQKMRSETG